MHIMEGFLPPVHAAAWGLASLPFLVMGARSVVRVTRATLRAPITRNGRDARLQTAA